MACFEDGECWFDDVFSDFPSPPPHPDRSLASVYVEDPIWGWKDEKAFLVASRCVKVGPFISTLRHVMHSNRMRDIVLNSKIVTHELKRKGGGTSKSLRRWGRKSQLRLKERYVWFMKRWHTTVTASPSVRHTSTCFFFFSLFHWRL
jgi:hypothetical protein